MPGMQSAAMTLLLPAGSCVGPGRTGSGRATVLSDLVLPRGRRRATAGQLTDYLDSLGLQRFHSVGVHHSRFGCAAIAENVFDALPAYADIVRRPHLPEDGFPRRATSRCKRWRAAMTNRVRSCSSSCANGTCPRPSAAARWAERTDSKADARPVQVRLHARYHAHGSILAVAGTGRFREAQGEVERHFGDWNGRRRPAFDVIPPPGLSSREPGIEQTHIGIAYPSSRDAPDYYTMRLAAKCSSGGMSGRLFTEIREKRRCATASGRATRR
jgi:predicted Zn-dependent peptidase